MKQPKRKTKEMILCVECKKPIHIDDLAMVTKEGMYHKSCTFKVFYMNSKGFLTGYEFKTKLTKRGLSINGKE